MPMWTSRIGPVSQSWRTVIVRGRPAPSIGVQFWLAAWLLGVGGAGSGGAGHADDFEYSTL
ncbi:hypothetical protein [Streptomyces sp. BH105]|uniref:hypothetical protein n=1 Tax=Streptomyces sp. BH105 TaxID=3410408 RepID=UPI003CE7AC0B